MQPYIKSTQLFNCPSDPFAGGSGANEFFTHPLVTPASARSSSYDQYGSYVYNATYVYNGTSCTSPGGLSWDGGAGVSLAAIEDVSGTLLIGESDKTNKTSALYFAGAWDTAPVITNTRPRRLSFYSFYEIAERHLETTNVLWVDGHVKATKLDRLLRLSNKGTGCYNAFTNQDDGN